MNTSQPTSIVTVERSYGGLQAAMSPTEALRRVQELQAFVHEVMKQGEDFGVIPGTQKPSLYQPGAQKLAEIYGLAPHFEDVTTVENWEKPFFHYRKKCVLTSRRSGDVVAEGIGSCNSLEERYAYRWVFENEVPAGTDKKILKRKEITSKRNGQRYAQYRLMNPDIFSQVNTIEKMAAKRAFVSAVISATRSAGIFTQDVEDLPKEVFGSAESHRSWEDEDDTSEQTPPTTSDSQARAKATVPESTIAEWKAGFARAISGDEIAAVSTEISERKADLPRAALVQLTKARREAEERIAASADPEQDGR